MILQLAGLLWDAPSPSFFRLVLPEQDGASVDVSFLGDRWFLFLQHRGDVSAQSFERRDDAMELVAQSFVGASNESP